MDDKTKLWYQEKAENLKVGDLILSRETCHKQYVIAELSETQMNGKNVIRIDTLPDTSGERMLMFYKESDVWVYYGLVGNKTEPAPNPKPKVEPEPEYIIDSAPHKINPVIVPTIRPPSI